jgi:hypothetical protein
MEYLVIFTKSGQQNIPLHASLHPLLHQVIANSEVIKVTTKLQYTTCYQKSIKVTVVWLSLREIRY